MTRQPTGRRAVENYARRDGFQDEAGVWHVQCQCCAEMKRAQSLRCVRRPYDMLGDGGTLIVCTRCKSDLMLT